MKRFRLVLVLGACFVSGGPAFSSGLMSPILADPKPLSLVHVERYTLQKGDNLSSLAQDRGLEVDTLLSFNSIRSPRLIRAGMTIQIPNRDGIKIKLDRPETVQQISQQFGVFASLLLEANRLKADTKILDGEVFVPGVKLDSQDRRKYLGELFAWPTVGGRISSYFGKRDDPFTGLPSMHSGVDIAVPWGSPVLAAGSGVVSYTGYNSILGNFIQVDQGRGYMVVYGHLSAILTRSGKRIVAGQQIGRVGSTGYSTGPHLHFGAYYNHRLLNPMTLFQ